MEQQRTTQDIQIIGVNFGIIGLITLSPKMAIVLLWAGTTCMFMSPVTTQVTLHTTMLSLKFVIMATTGP